MTANAPRFALIYFAAADAEGLTEVQTRTFQSLPSSMLASFHLIRTYGATGNAPGCPVWVSVL